MITIMEDLGRRLKEDGGLIFNKLLVKYGIKRDKNGMVTIYDEQSIVNNVNIKIVCGQL